MAAYQALIGIAEEVVAGARKAVDDTAAMRGKDPLTALKIAALRDQIARYCDFGARVIDQARRRVLDGEQVPTSEKIYSIFEPRTDLIKRGKVRTPVEFGHKVLLAESAKGVITQYDVLKGNPEGLARSESMATAPCPISGTMNHDCSCLIRRFHHG
jgi:IS5 family transposase